MTLRATYLGFLLLTSCYQGPWEDLRSLGAAVSFDGQTLVVAEDRWQGSSDGAVRRSEERMFVFDLATGREIQSIPWRKGSAAKELGPDGELLLMSHEPGGSELHRPGEAAVPVPVTGEQRARSLSPDGRWILRLANATMDETDTVYDIVSADTMEPTGAELTLPWVHPLTTPGSLFHDWTPQGRLYVDDSRLDRAWLMDPAEGTVEEVDPLPNLCARGEISEEDLATVAAYRSSGEFFALAIAVDATFMVLVQRTAPGEFTYEVLPATPASDEEIMNRVPPYFEHNFGMRYPTMSPDCWDALRPVGG